MASAKKYKSYPPYTDPMPFDSFRQALDFAAIENGGKDAFRYKIGEEIVSVSYNAFKSDVRALVASLRAEGLESAHIAIVSENRYEWILAFYALLCGKTVAVPIDGALPFSEIEHILAHSDSEAVFVSKPLEPRFREAVKEGRLGNIKKIICIDSKKEEDTGKFVSLSVLLHEGKILCDGGDNTYETSEIDDYGLKLLVFTSGTTGTSKGVMLSAHNIRSVVYYGERINRLGDRPLSILPYTHTYASVCDVITSIHRHTTLCINESLRALQQNFKIYKPDYMFTVPLVAENLYKKIWSTVESSGKEKAFRTLLSVSDGMRKVGIDARRRLFKSVHEVFGGELTKIVCGGAPLRPEMIKFFDQIGILLCNGYGITECSPLVSVQRDKNNDPLSAGVVLECNQIKIDAPNEDGEGEILVRGDVTMLGYYKNEAATAAVFDGEGYFRTGDYGRYDPENGQLYITGRKKNLIVLKNGKNVYPEEIEGYVAQIQAVAEVVVFSNRNEDGDEISLGAEIFLDEAIVKDLDREQRKTLIKSEIDRVNKPLPPYKHVSTVRIRAAEFEKTTSRKIRRSDLGKDAETIKN